MRMNVFSFLLQHGDLGIIEMNVAQAKEKRRPDMLRAKALEYLQEYKKKQEGQTHDNPSRRQSWVAPLVGKYKANID